MTRYYYEKWSYIPEHYEEVEPSAANPYEHT